MMILRLDSSVMVVSLGAGIGRMPFLEVVEVLENGEEHSHCENLSISWEEEC